MTGQLGVVVGTLRVIRIEEREEGGAAKGEEGLVTLATNGWANGHILWYVSKSLLPKFTINTELWVEAPEELFAKDDE